MNAIATNDIVLHKVHMSACIPRSSGCPHLGGDGCITVSSDP